jgi:hypothetical protein
MSDSVQVRYAPSKTTKRFLKSNARVRALIGPLGSGKSSACAVEALRRACSAVPCRDGVRRTRGVIVRNTYPELRDTTRKTFEEWVPRECGTWVENENKFVMKFDDGNGPIESEVLFRSLDRPDDIRKLLSLELTWAWLNEGKELSKAAFDMIQSRVGRYPAKKNFAAGAKPWFGVWLDTNPPDTDHWIYRIFEEERPEGFELFRQPGGREPDAENLQFLPEGYYQNLCHGKDAEWVKVYVDGQYGYVRDGKPVYPEWRDTIHVQACLRNEKFGPVLLGQDFGLTPAAVIGQRDPSDGQLQILDELVSEDMGALQFGETLVRKLKLEMPGEVRGHGDPAGDQRAQTDEKTPFDIMRSVGLMLRSAPTNDFIRRREAVARGLTRLTLKGRPSLVIDPRCKQLRKAMAGGYCYKRIQVTGDERFRDVPDKNRFSHVAEALQYLCVGEGEDRAAIPVANPDEFRLNLRVRRSLGRYR